MQNVIVTGASRGIGLATARQLAAAGYRVIAIARSNSAELIDASREAGRTRPNSLVFRAFDLDRISGIPQLFRQLRKDFGAIYGLVNNAAAGTSGVLATMRDTQIENLVRLNAISPIVLTKYVVRSMMADGGGRVVNIASIVGPTGYSGLSVYGATKAAIIGFTKSLAREVGRVGINVNAVAPGFVATAMTKGLGAEHRSQITRRSALRRLAQADDVGNAVEFLLDARSKNITGMVLTVDAGATA